MESVSIKFDVWRKFYPPFRCICCRQEISKEQFKFSCMCSYCDLGKCCYSQSGYNPYKKGHGLKLWKNAEIDKQLQVLEELKK